MKFVNDAFDRFAKKTPISVMVRATIENVLSTQRLDAIFDENAEQQYVGDLLFSTVADIMGQVVCQIHPSVNAAYIDRRDEIGVTVKAVYDKLKGIETSVSRALVRDTATRMQAIIKQTGGLQQPLLAGYRTKIVDGNHLRRTDRRIGELRKLNAAPLPGKSLVVFDPQYRLALDVLPCEDGHAQERSLLPELLETVEADDMWMADRNFCTVAFLFGIGKRHGKFIIRQHGSLPFTLKGRRKRVGETETGTVYEQAMEVSDEDGNTRVYRRITVKLNEPTRDGDTEIHLVTNLPKRVGAIHIADLYRDRWQIETAFQEVAENLEGEIQTLGYPKAALFGFCMALVTYNLLSVVRAAVHAVHGAAAAQELSTYYVSLEVASTAVGMSVILEGEFWRDKYRGLTPTQMAAELKQLARHIRLSKFKKGKWTPKKKPKQKMNKKDRGHKSTLRILEQSRKQTHKAA
ncbi:MAG: transposase [Planctomycetaceae bacterium]|nr:transposase [Planctomycetaceae bacterium]HRX79333.1 transposase [Pirellulaceae bacterium]